MLSLVIIARDYISECLGSIFNQTLKYYKTIVVDGGSTDATKDIVLSYSGDVIKYFSQENTGPSAARNRGISNASGHYNAFLDADDTWLPKRLASQLAVLAADNDMAFSFSDYFISMC